MARSSCRKWQTVSRRTKMTAGWFPSRGVGGRSTFRVPGTSPDNYTTASVFAEPTLVGGTSKVPPVFSPFRSAPGSYATPHAGEKDPHINKIIPPATPRGGSCIKEGGGQRGRGAIHCALRILWGLGFIGRGRRGRGGRGEDHDKSRSQAGGHIARTAHNTIVLPHHPLVRAATLL